LNGTLKCPSFTDFCINSRKLCPNWCNQQGFCMGGVCNCLNGFSGPDCSIKICTANQFYDTLSKTCVSNSACPLGYYANIYDSTCEKCFQNCTSCINLPNNCQSCLLNFVLYQQTCLNSCPAKYFNLSNVCTSCDTTC
jgi:hypothetical protein